MSTEVKEKLEVRKTASVRIEMPRALHKKIRRYQLSMTGRPTFNDSIIELLNKALEKQSETVAL